MAFLNVQLRLFSDRRNIKRLAIFFQYLNFPHYLFLNRSSSQITAVLRLHRRFQVIGTGKPTNGKRSENQSKKRMQPKPENSAEHYGQPQNKQN